MFTASYNTSKHTKKVLFYTRTIHERWQVIFYILAMHFIYQHAVLASHT